MLISIPLKKLQNVSYTVQQAEKMENRVIPLLSFLFDQRFWLVKFLLNFCEAFSTILNQHQIMRFLTSPTDCFNFFKNTLLETLLLNVPKVAQKE